MGNFIKKKIKLECLVVFTVIHYLLVWKIILFVPDTFALEKKVFQKNGSFQILILQWHQ